MKKTFENESGNLLVRAMEGTLIAEGSNIVEMLHLYDKNKIGCVVGFWVLRYVDHSYFLAEFNEVHDRMTTSNIDSEVLMDALKFGRRLADLLIDVNQESKKQP